MKMAISFNHFLVSTHHALKRKIKSRFFFLIIFVGLISHLTAPAQIPAFQKTNTPDKLPVSDCKDNKVTEQARQTITQTLRSSNNSIWFEKK
jgi:hypothetical protein